MKKKFQELMQQYGPVAVVIYFTIFFLVWGGFAFAIKFGLDVGLGPSGDAPATEATVNTEGTAAKFGVWTAAYLATKATQPLRIGATLLLTPVVGRLVQRLRGVRPPATPPPAA